MFSCNRALVSLVKFERTAKAYLQRHGQRSALAVVVDGRTGAEEERGSGGGEERRAAEGGVCGISFKV